MEETLNALAVISLIVAIALAQWTFDKSFRVPAKHFLPYLAWITHIAICLNVRADADIFYYFGFVLLLLIFFHGCSHLMYCRSNRDRDNEQR